MRRSPEALSDGGLVLQLGNLLLFIDGQYRMVVPEEISSVENSTGIVVGQLKAICT